MKKTLVLNRETIRELTNKQLERVEGGGPTQIIVPPGVCVTEKCHTITDPGCVCPATDGC